MFQTWCGDAFPILFAAITIDPLYLEMSLWIIYECLVLNLVNLTYINHSCLFD